MPDEPSVSLMSVMMPMLSPLLCYTTTAAAVYSSSKETARKPPGTAITFLSMRGSSIKKEACSAVQVPCPWAISPGKLAAKSVCVGFPL